MTPTRVVYRLAATTDADAADDGQPALHLRLQPARVARPRGAVLYVHGATFPSALSVFFRFDGRSWADALNEAGFDAWGLDFAGYGESARDGVLTAVRADGDRVDDVADAADAAEVAEVADVGPTRPRARSRDPAVDPPGRAAAAQAQLARAMRTIAGLTAQPLHLLAHSWGSLAALRCAGDPTLMAASLVLFGPLACRDRHREGDGEGDGDGDIRSDAADANDPEPLPPTRLLTAWAQYRRFIADLPPGEPPVLADAHIDAWAQAFLASDPLAHRRTPPAVRVPNGPAADVAALWSGHPLYDASQVRVPTLLVYGEWDSVFDARDAERLRAELCHAPVHTRRLARGTHLMHLESGRHALHRAVNEFLLAQPIHASSSEPR